MPSVAFLESTDPGQMASIRAARDTAETMLLEERLHLAERQRELAAAKCRRFAAEIERALEVPCAAAPLAADRNDEWAGVLNFSSRQTAPGGFPHSAEPVTHRRASLDLSHSRGGLHRGSSRSPSSSLPFPTSSSSSSSSSSGASKGSGRRRSFESSRLGRAGSSRRSSNSGSNSGGNSDCPHGKSQGHRELSKQGYAEQQFRARRDSFESDRAAAEYYSPRASARNSPRVATSHSGVAATTPAASQSAYRRQGWPQQEAHEGANGFVQHQYIGGLRHTQAGGGGAPTEPLGAPQAEHGAEGEHAFRASSEFAVPADTDAAETSDPSDEENFLRSQCQRTYTRFPLASDDSQTRGPQGSSPRMAGCMQATSGTLDSGIPSPLNWGARPTESGQASCVPDGRISSGDETSEPSDTEAFLSPSAIVYTRDQRLGQTRKATRAKKFSSSIKGFFSK